MLEVMSTKTYQVKDVARLAKVTVRTLHHYDSIGLLVPAGRSPSGYRPYEEGDLLRLQQILVCRELGIPLEQVRRMLDDPGLDRRRLLQEHRRQLVGRARATEAMIRSLDVALEALKGEKKMDRTRCSTASTRNSTQRKSIAGGAVPMPAISPAHRRILGAGLVAHPRGR